MKWASTLEKPGVIRHATSKQRSLISSIKKKNRKEKPPERKISSTVKSATPDFANDYLKILVHKSLGQQRRQRRNRLHHGRLSLTARSICTIETSQTFETVVTDARRSVRLHSLRKWQGNTCRSRGVDHRPTLPTPMGTGGFLHDADDDGGIDGDGPQWQPKGRGCCKFCAWGMVLEEYGCR